MGRSGVLLMWGAVADMAVENNEGWTVFLVLENIKGVPDPIDVVGVANPQNIPSVGQKPGGDVLREGDARVSLDGDVVVVVNPAKIIQAQMGGERCCLR